MHQFLSTCPRLSKHVDAMVATHPMNRETLSRYGIGSAEIAYFDTEYISRPVWSVSQSLRFNAASMTALGALTQVAFEWEVWKHFKNDLKKGRFDLIHRISPTSSAVPSPIARWSKVPFLLGPVNGGLKWPKQFSKELRKEGEWLRYVRGLNRYLPYVRGTYERAALVFAAFQHTIDNLPIKSLDRVMNIPDIGIDPAMYPPPQARAPRKRLIFLFAGRLVPFKCADIAVAAFGASPELRRHCLLITGQGPERGHLEEIVRELSLESCVEFLGYLPSQGDVAEVMRTADVFVFPSIRESGGGAVIEAMASGLACVVVDHGGPASLVTSVSGVKIPLASREEITERLTRELERLATDSAYRQRLGAAAAERAQHYFTWDFKAKKMVEGYRWVLGQRAEKPEYFETSP